MPNHVHIIVVPRDEDGLRRTLGDLRRRYTGYINARMRTTGHLWKGRFSSVAMDEAHLVAALRYVAVNPVRARLTRRATDWKWSSSRAPCEGADDGTVTVAPARNRVGDFTPFLDEAFDEAPMQRSAKRKALAAPLARLNGWRIWKRRQA